MRTLLKNGLIADGSGKPLYKADVLLSGNVIEKIAENVDSTPKYVELYDKIRRINMFAE